MTWRLEQLREDRHVRDAARALVEADLKNLRADLSVRSMGDRAVDRLTQGASEVYEEAIEVAADNKGALAAIIAALALWFARHPILEALFGEDDR
jgi:hypothetical protein